MEIKLSDKEIREALVEHMAKKLDYAVDDIHPDNCWFEVKADRLEGEDAEDISEVKFCFDTES